MTVPAPVPDFDTVNPNCFTLKLATTDLAESMVTTQFPVPEQPPDQPVKLEFASGPAVRVTCVPGRYGSLQSLPQSIPAGLLVTAPLPVPVLLTERTAPKVAVTVLAESIVTTQTPVPLHAPPHPMKVKPLSAAAVRVT